MNINLRIEDKKSSYLELRDINSPDIAYMNINNKVNSNNNIYLLKKKRIDRRMIRIFCLSFFQLQNCEPFSNHSGMNSSDILLC